MDRLLAQVAQRRSLGLRADPAYVAGLVTDGVPDDPMFGVPLTEEERAHFAGQAARHDLLERLERQFEPQGVWGGGRLGGFGEVPVTIGLTRSPSAEDAAAIDALRGELRVVVRLAHVPYAMLLAVAEEIQRSGIWDAEHLNAVGPDPDRGVVEVRVHPAAVPRVEALLDARFGSVVRVVAGGPAIALATH